MQGAERKMWRLEEEEARAGAATTFQAYDQKLETVKPLSYLWHLFTDTGDEWPSVIVNLWC